MSEPKEPRKPANPRMRASLYGLGALYLAYMYYQIAKPYLTGDPYGPSLPQFVLGTIILGGGAVVIGLLAWKIYRTPLPEEDVQEEPEEELEESED
ncbi:hypothetical protein AALC17_01730 [Oscillospiraceae bacterium 38-13]